MKIPAFAQRMGEIEGAPEGAPSDSREVQISFSSEHPYKRYDYENETDFLEVLGHRNGEADLARLNSGQAPLLKDHMPTLDSKVGNVVKAWVANGRGHAVVRFSSTPAGDELLARVRSGDVTCVSFGYSIESAERAPDKDGVPVVRATRWAAKEISFVAIPADPTVGYGRADGGEINKINVTEKDANMADELNNPAPTVPAKAKTPPADHQRSEPVQSSADILTAERTRATGIDEIATRFDVPVKLVNEAKRNGTSVEAFGNLTLDYLGSGDAEATRAGATMIGLTTKEKESFSVVKLLRSLANPTEGRFKKDAGFELEAVAAATDGHKGQVRGVILPTDITMHTPHSMRTRASDQLAGTPGLGGNLVDDVLMSGSMIDVLRNVSILAKMGVRVFGGLSGDVSFPKHLTDVSAFWVPEDGGPSQSGMTFGQVKMSPRTCAAMTELSRKLLLQTSTDVEAYARMSIISSIALKIDAAGLNGDADPDAPNGLADEAGVNETDFAIAGQPTYAEVINMRTKVKKQNALLGSLGYVFSPDIEEHLLTTPRLSGADNPIMVDEGRLGGYRAEATNQAAVDEMWFGNWSDLYMGLWSGLDIMVDPYTNSASGAVRVVAHQDVDFAVARAQSFTRGKLIVL